MKAIVSILVASILMTSCATVKNVGNDISKALKDPATVQLIVTAAGKKFIVDFTSGDKAIVHRFAVSLLQLTAANVDSVTIDGLVPASASQYVNIVVNYALLTINTYLKNFGAHNPQVVAYVQAVGQGLLDAGF